MGKNTNKYSENYIQKEVVDYLEKDGALCDYYSKYYKEKETYEGGVGDRKAFKNYNDKINKYHNILKVLTGERRANIYEAIPAIDFTDPTFTNFCYTYEINTNSNTGKTEINNDTIVPIPSELDKTTIELLEDEDGYTINRALLGEGVAEHFYNTTSLISSCYDLQVSPYILEADKYKYIYCGVIIPRTFKNGVYTNDIRVTELLYYPVTSATSMYFDADTPRMVGAFNDVYYEEEDGTSIPCLVDVLQSDDTTSKVKKATKNIILNVDCDWTPYDSSYKPVTDTYKKGIIHLDSAEFGDVTIIKKTDIDTVEYNYFGHYQLNLDAGDYIVAVPSNAYTLSSTKLIIFKKNNTESKESVTSSYATAYFNSYNSHFYENSDFTIAVNPSAEKYEGKYFVAEGNETLDYVYSYSSLTTTFVKVSPTAIDTVNKTITVQKSKNPYNCYVLYIKGFNKDINSFSSTTSYDPSSIFTKVYAGDEMPSVLMEDFIYSKLKDYLSVEVNYLAGASGLLSGYFSTPYEYTDSGNSSTVTKWSFLNERQLALQGGMDIDIGSKYFSGHLLNRGSIIASPLMLTASDSLGDKKYNDLIAEGYKGKATLFLDTLLSMGNIYDKILSKYCVKDNSEFFRSKNTIQKVITSDNFKDGTLYYSDRYKRANTVSPIGLEDIYNYITTWKEILDGDTLTIDLDSNAVRYQSSLNTTIGSGIFLSGNTTSSGKSLSDFSKLRKEISKETIEGGSPAVIAFYYISKSVSKWWGSNSYDKFSHMYTTFYSPWDLVRSKEENNNNILIFPSEKKYYPEEVVLMSRKSLGLVKDTPCFFHKDGKLIGFMVKDVISILPSKIKKINIKTNGSIVKTANKVYKKEDEEYEYYISSIDSMELVDDHASVDSMDYGNNNTSSSSWTLLFNGSKDCYVYKLSCINCGDIQKDLTFHDADDKEITVSELSSYSKLIPFSYSVNTSDRLFNGKKTISDDGSYSIYNVYPENRGDFYSLVDYDIFGGVPKYTYQDSSCSIIKLDNTLFSREDKEYVTGFFATFASLINSAQANSKELISGMLKDLLSNWQFSTSTSNPILLKELPQIFDGLLLFSKEIHDLTDDGITINNNGRILTLSRREFKNLIGLIDNGRKIRKYNTSVTLPTNIETVDSSLTLEETCNKYIASQLNNVSVNINNPNGTSWNTDSGIEYYSKSSIYNLDNLFNSLFVSKEFPMSISEARGICNQLDNYFGNNTQAFLSIGESVTSAGETVDDSSSIESFRNLIIDSVAGVVENVIKTVMRTETSLDTAFATLKTNYKNYYTSESVEEGVTLKGDEISVDWYKLIPLKEKKSLILEAYDNAESITTSTDSQRNRYY